MLWTQMLVPSLTSHVTLSKLVHLFSCKKRVIIVYYHAVVQSLSHVRLCNPVNCSPAGSSVHGIFQARVLEWVAISFSRGSSHLRDLTHVSCIGRQILYH